MDGVSVLRGLTSSTLFILAIVGIIVGAVCFATYNSQVDWYTQWCTGEDMALMQMLDSAHAEECQNSSISRFGYQVGYILSFGCSAVSILFTLPIMLSGGKRKQPEFERGPITATQKWCANCPNCDAVNYGTIQQMQATIDCGKCSVSFTPSSLEKYHGHSGTITVPSVTHRVSGRMAKCKRCWRDKWCIHCECCVYCCYCEEEGEFDSG